MQSKVGECAGPYTFQLSSEIVQEFKKTVGSTEQIPPTLYTIFRKAEFELLNRLGLTLDQILHAEQEYIYENAVLEQDLLSYQTTIKQVAEKKGGALVFIVLNTEVFKNKNRVAQCISTLVHKRKL